MSFPAARWRCQLIARGLGAALAAACAQLSGKNWAGRRGQISYRSLGGAAGPRSALMAGARPGPAALGRGLHPSPRTCPGAPAALRPARVHGRRIDPRAPAHPATAPVRERAGPRVLGA